MDATYSSVVFKFKATGIRLKGLRIVGNYPEFGSWNPFQATTLSPSYGEFWSSEVISISGTEPIEYKYYFTLADGTEEWEPLLYNRKLVLQEALITVEDEAHSFVSRVLVSKDAMKNCPVLPLKFPDFPASTRSKPLLLASHGLPYEVVKVDSEYTLQRSKGIWMNLLYDVLKKNGTNFVWVGYCGCHVPFEDQDKVRTLLDSVECYPVFLEEEVLTRHLKFCNGPLRSTLHNIIEHFEDPSLWRAYREVNLIFSETILEVYKKHCIWVHDYHLLLTPEFLSRKTREVLNIGVFMHSPFPSSEVFRTLPQHQSILYGLCCCDLIGFHCFEYSRHFVGICKRVIGIDVEFSHGGYLSLSFSGRNIMLRTCHIGVEPQLYNRPMVDFSGDVAVFLGVDSLSHLSGIHLKFNAFRAAAKKISTRIQLLQVITSSKRPEGHLLEDLIALQKEINEENGFELIQIRVQNISTEERLQLMQESLALINTSLRDGMCLLPFEYILLKKTPLVILSEFAGASRALSSPIRINPYNVRFTQIADLVGAIENVIDENYKETYMRSVTQDREFLMNNTTSDWANSFVEDLERSAKNCKEFQFVELGIGEKLKLIALPKAFYHLDKHDVVDAYMRSSNRALFFDNEGTLCNFEKLIEEDLASAPSSSTKRYLHTIAADVHNTVYIITGREPDTLDKWYGGIPKLGLASEYGAFMKWNNGPWELKIPGNPIWKETALNIIQSYVKRTEGSVMVCKETSVGFLYRDSEQEFAEWQAKDLRSQLEILLSPYSDQCEISVGIGYVEVKPRNTNKGEVIFEVLQKINKKKGSPVDFLMAVGDDVSDEFMFKMVNSLESNHSHLLAPRASVFTCTIGVKPSSAKFYVNHSEEIVQLLDVLKNWSFKRNRHATTAITTVKSHSNLLSVDTHSVKRVNSDLLSPIDECLISPLSIISTAKKQE